LRIGEAIGWVISRTSTMRMVAIPKVDRFPHGEERAQAEHLLRRLRARLTMR
jgi:hypothetical protein